MTEINASFHQTDFFGEKVQTEYLFEHFYIMSTSFIADVLF